MGMAESFFTGQNYFVAYMVYVPVPQKLIFFPKNPSLKMALFVNVGVAQSIFTRQIYFHWPKKGYVCQCGSG